MERTWKSRFETELRQAQFARQDGNEGKARVCARRAAGILAGEYLAHHGLPPGGPSAYDRLRSLHAVSSLPDPVRAIVSHFLVRITPDHELPIQADLIAEARWLADHLLE